MPPNISPLTTPVSTASSQSIATGADGSFVIAYQNYGPTNYNLSALFGIYSPTEYIVYGTDVDFDTGDYPSIAIDPNGLAVSVHETNAIGDATIMVNIGHATGGQGNLTQYPSISTNMVGSTPSIAAIGVNSFVVAAVGPTEELLPLKLWLLQIQDGNVILTSPITFNMGSGGGNWLGGGPTCNQYPQVSYRDGNLAVSGGLMGGLEWWLGPLDGSVFTPSVIWSIPGNNNINAGSAVALGPNNAVYAACLTTVGIGENDIIYWEGTYTVTSTLQTGTVEWTSQGQAGMNYALGVSLASLNVGSLNTVLMAVLIDGAGQNGVELFKVT